MAPAGDLEFTGNFHFKFPFLFIALFILTAAPASKGHESQVRGRSVGFWVMWLCPSSWAGVTTHLTALGYFLSDQLLTGKSHMHKTRHCYKEIITEGWLCQLELGMYQRPLNFDTGVRKVFQEQ